MPPSGRRPGRGRGRPRPSATGSAASPTSPATTPTRQPASPMRQPRSRRSPCPTPAHSRPQHEPPDRSPAAQASLGHVDGRATPRVTRRRPTAVADRSVPCRTENGADDMTAATSTSITAPPPTRPPGLRLQLDPTRAGTGAVDGGWWPRSRDPDAELPDLIASLDASLGPITRVALNLGAWDTAPRRVAVDGRRVRVGWFRQMDAHTIGVARAAQDRVLLLVIPPPATTAAAEMAMAMAADAANSARPTDILAAAGIGGRDPAPMPPSHSHNNGGQAA